MGLTKDALEQMGFTKIPLDLTIEAHFCSLNVYKIQGLHSGSTSPLKPEELKCIDKEISFTLSDSVNEACQVLLGEDFVNEERKWQEDNKTLPPYLVVLTRLDRAASCSNGYWKQEQERIVTHDCFSDTKHALQNLENQRASLAVTALSASLSNDRIPVLFIPIAREVFAKTNLNMRLVDLHFEFLAEGHLSGQITPSIILEKMTSSLDMAKSLHPKVGYFFGLAVKENDRLKKFLYLYLAIEIHTHNTFKNLNYSGTLVGHAVNSVTIPLRAQRRPKYGRLASST